MQLEDGMLTTALFYCCDSDLRTDLMRDIRQNVTDMTEQELLNSIKRLAVRDESTLVHRIRLSRMTQTPGTSIRTFLAGLRGQAALCGYTAVCKEPNCTHTFDYSDEIIKDHLIRGIADPEILSDLLGDPKTDRTLEETVCFIAQKEQGKVTQTAVGECAGAMSSIRKTPQIGRGSECWACGKQSHGPKNDIKTRAKKCEAWTITCSKCSIKGHYTSRCAKCSTCGSWGHRNSLSKRCPQHPQQNQSNSAANMSVENSPETCSGYVYDQLCAANTTECHPHTRSAINHHVYVDGQWVPRPSKPHPILTVKMEIGAEDHAALGFPLVPTPHLQPITLPMVADSGCQSSIIPLKTILATGLQQHQLLPVRLVMKGAITEDLGVIGAVAVQISIGTHTGQPRNTRIMCYVSEIMEKAFLCREALISLGLLSPDFPNAPPTAAYETAHVLSEGTCKCPIRSRQPPPLPTRLPDSISPTEENVDAIKEWLLDYYASSTFNVCEHQPLPIMSGEPLRLHIDSEARPVAVHKPAIVPLHWQDKVYEDLERDVRIGVLERVDANTPTTWCSRMVITAKADGTPRRTIDLQPLNRNSVRQTHHVPSPFNLASSVPQGVKKTVTDAWNGYHSVPLHIDDRHYTTFITPWGRYRYKVAPQGFIASGDAYNQRFDSIISDFPNKVKCVDDTCMWADDIEGAFLQTCKWLDLCARNGVTLNPRKFQFAQDTVNFAGLQITPTNIQPGKKFMDSIQLFPTPKDITGARAWFGLVNQGAYAFSMTKHMQPFRHLLKPSTKFIWTDELNDLFIQSKNIIIQEMKEGVRLFDTRRPTCLSTDWSVNGVGFTLLQKYCSCKERTPVCCATGWKTCLFGSRFTHPAESRYAPIEGEALAVAYALHQSRYFILGCTDLLVATDHKPLLNILNDRSLSEIDNRRLLNLKEKTMAYKFTIMHVPGKRNLGPDAVSRYPQGSPTPTNSPCENNTKPICEALSVNPTEAEDTSTVIAATCTLAAVSNVITWGMVKEATASDPSMRALQEHIEAGWPEDARTLPDDIRPYHRYASGLCVIDGVTLMGHRLVIPCSLRPSILNALHAAHQGVRAMQARASDTVYWPDITVDIIKTRERCTHCHKIAKSNPMQPSVEPRTPDYPFQLICCDYFTYNNRDYVVIVDRYSGWPMVYRSENGADGLVKRLRETFVTFGIPEELTSDGGPQFTSGKTRSFLENWGVLHRVTSVANAHANSRAEIAVKTIKRMLMNNTGPTGSLDVDAFQRAMLIYRNSIDPDTKASPALILFSRPIRDAIPIIMGRYKPHNTWLELAQHREIALAKRHSREREKWDEHTKLLPQLRVGDHVYIQNLTGNHPTRWERTGIIIEVRQFHQYVVRVDGSGRVTLRNRQHLRRFTPFHKPATPAIAPPRQETLPRVTPPANSKNLPPAPEELDHQPLSPPDSGPTEVTADSDEQSGVRYKDPTPCTLAPEPASTPAGHTPSDSQSPASPAPTPPTKPKLSRALARLLPHNQAGLKEATSGSRRCRGGDRD
jgi:hypothetical protein